MPNFGLTSLGFLPKQQQDIISEIESSLQQAFGTNINLLPTSVFGQLVGIFSEREALLWQLAEAVYNSQYPKGAEGTSVDNILALTGLTRLPATPTKTAPNENGNVGLVFYGTPGTIIPAGSLINVDGSPQSPSFTTDSSVTISTSVDCVQSLTTAFIPDAGYFNLKIGSVTTNNIQWNSLASGTQILFNAVPASGDFTIKIGNQETANIPFTATSLNVQAAIQALAGYNTATVSGNFTNGFVISWGSIANPLITISVNTMGVLITPVDSLQAIINQGKTVVLSPSGDTTIASNLVTNLSSTSGLEVGQYVSGTGIPPETTIFDITGNTITLSQNATANGVAVSLTFYTLDYEGVTVTGSYVTGFFITFSGDSGAKSQPLMTTPVNNLFYGVTAVNIKLVITQVGAPAQAIGSATCSQTGPVIAPANTLTIIGSPVAGWDSVTNPLDALPGTNLESDSDALVRRLTLLGANSNGTLESIVAKVQAVGNVVQAIGFENTDIIPDLSGRPAKSFEIVVQGGDNQNIAEAIYGSKPAGILAFGDTTVTVTDSFGFPHSISFSRPTQVPIYISINMVVRVDTFPSDGVQTIQTELVAIGNSIPIGGIVIGFGSDGLIGAFNNVPGIQQYTMYFGKNPNPLTNTNVVLASEELAQFESYNIIVQVTYL